MIRILQGQQNVWLLPRVEILTTLGGSFVLTAVHETSKVRKHCELVDDQSMDDYLRFTITEKPAAADPLQGEISLREEGNWLLILSEAPSFTNDPNLQIELRTERAYIRKT